MKPVYQTRRGGSKVESGERGNCYGACVASILEMPLECVPDLSPEVEHQEAWDVWFTDHGLWVVTLEAMDITPPGYSIGTSFDGSSGDGHSLVCEGGVVVHDPDSETTNDPLAYRITYHDLLVPLDPVTIQRHQRIRSRAETSGAREGGEARGRT